MILTLFLREDATTTRWWVVTHPLGSLNPLDPREQFSSPDFVKCQRKQFQNRVWPRKSLCGAVFYLQSAGRYVAVRMWARA